MRFAVLLLVFGIIPIRLCDRSNRVLTKLTDAEPSAVSTSVKGCEGISHLKMRPINLFCHRCSLISLPSVAKVDSSDERVGLVYHHDLFVVCPEVALHIRAGVWVS